MARTRRGETTAMKEAIQKIAGMKAIDETLDLGNDVSIMSSEADLADARVKLENYNRLLAMIDESLNIFNVADLKLRAGNKKILPAVGLKYGTDSDEYEKVGGKRESERARRTVKPKPTVPTTK